MFLTRLWLPTIVALTQAQAWLPARGPAASGNNIDTASVGAKTFTVNASDVAGNVSSKSVNYNVAYSTCLLYDTTHAAKSGSTIPVKFDLCDAAGNNVSSSNITVTALQVVMITNNATSDVIDAGECQPRRQFPF